MKACMLYAHNGLDRAVSCLHESCGEAIHLGRAGVKMTTSVLQERCFGSR